MKNSTKTQHVTGAVSTSNCGYPNLFFKFTERR